MEVMVNDMVPIISVDGEDENLVTNGATERLGDCLTDVENWSDSEAGDGEDEDERGEDSDTTLCVGLTVTKTKKKRKSTKDRQNARTVASTGSQHLVVSLQGEDGGVTDTETLDVDEEEAEKEELTKVTYLEEIPGFYDALRPKIVEIVEDEEGKTHVKTITKHILVQDVDQDSGAESDNGPGTQYQSMLSVPNADGGATDIESLDGSSVDEVEYHSSEEMVAVLQDYECAVAEVATARTDEVEKDARRVPPSKKHHRKHGNSKASVSQTHLVVGDADIEHLTDVEYIDEVNEQPESKTLGSRKTHVTVDPNFLAPNIVITFDESSDVESGRSSRSSFHPPLTDVEDLDDEEQGKALEGVSASGLLAPASGDDGGSTDIEDIDMEGDEIDSRMVPNTVPRNGPAASSPVRRIIHIQEDEQGFQIVTENSEEMRSISPCGALLVPETDGGTTDVEYLAVSGDEADASSRITTPDLYFEERTTIQVQDGSSGRGLLSLPDRSGLSEYSDVSDDDQPAQRISSGKLLTVPSKTKADGETDVEDLDVSDLEGGEGGDEVSQDEIEQYTSGVETSHTEAAGK